ncbi:MAG TPA: enoyl-CoA hydratase/isomerase family protein [Acidimicrobiia bacterium]|nr:enoyl-CoA hydratase/isomerase family protein [Acidimicrobiia bacterium]
MPVVEVDARLLAAGPAAVDAVLADHLGAPAVVVVTDVGAVTTEQWALLSEVPLLVAAAVPPDGPDAPRPDVLLADDLSVEALCAQVDRVPLAATAAALLLRTSPADRWVGLVRESTTYSMLQAGPEFRAWLDGRRGARPGPDAAPRVRVVRHDGLTEIILTRGGRHNALDRRLRDELDAALRDSAAQTGPIMVLGEGPSFCSGGDLDEFGSSPDPVAAHLVRLGRSLATRFARLADRLVVGLHGSCLGAGIELAAFARHVVAADDARVGLPELGLGLVPGAGGTVSLPARIGRQRTLRLLLAGDTLSAPTALGWGLVDEVVHPSRLRARCLEIAESLP